MFRSTNLLGAGTARKDHLRLRIRTAFALRSRLVAIVALSLWLGSAAHAQTGQNVVPIERNIHAVFVGIDEYQHSATSSPQFKNLRGAVGDAYRFKQALAEFYGLDVDRHQDGTCVSANAVSRTLTNACATRKAILDALEQSIAELNSGDTLLFYFAGHGSMYRDDRGDGVLDQSSGYNSTIMPSDARDPDNHESPGDIFDFEIRDLKERAVAKGIYFVTIFDSCHSGTGSRRVFSRFAPPGVARSGPDLARWNITVPTGSNQAGQGSGYWVHLAASHDLEEAQETLDPQFDARAGVFTTALIDTLRDEMMRNATFGDIIREVQLRVRTSGHISQTPMGEGELDAALGTRSRPAVLYEANFDSTKVTIAAGSLSGITKGSIFVLYASQKDALDRTGQLGSGAITEVSEYASTIEIADRGNLRDRMVAELSARAYPPQSVSVTNAISEDGPRDIVNAGLGAMEFVSLEDNGAYRIVEGIEDPQLLELYAADGTVLAIIPGIDGRPDIAKLRTALERVARVQQLLALRNDPLTGDRGLRFCIAPKGYRPRSCPALGPDGMRELVTTPNKDERAVVTVVNDLEKSAYIYVFAIDRMNNVDLVIPGPDEDDMAIAPGQLIQSRPIPGFGVDGLYRFLVIGTEQKINAEGLQQNGGGSNSRAVCSNPLERLLCSANKGTRDPTVTSVGDWTAIVEAVRVVRNGGMQ